MLWLIFLISSIINWDATYSYMVRSILQRLIIHFIFFILVFNEIYFDQGLRNKLKKTVVFSILFMEAFYITGTGVEYIEGRLIIFESNSNSLGMWVSTAILLALDIIIFENPRGKKLLFYIFVIAIGFNLVVLTGSRKAIIMVMAGIIVYYIFLNRSFLYKLKILVPLIIFGFIAFIYVSNNELLVERFGTEIERRDFGGRKPIWEASIEIIKTNPFFGVGIGEFSSLMVNRLGRLRSTHNEFLTVAAYGGIAGLFFFILFLSALVRKSLLILKQDDSGSTSLPFALLFMQSIYLFSGGGALTSFFSWFIFAFIAAESGKQPDHFINDDKSFSN